MGGFFYDELEIGQVFEFERIITKNDVVQFAEISGDNNPIHLDEEYAKTTRFGECIAHGALTASFISAAIGTKLPGPGCIFVSLNMRFMRPVKIGVAVLTKVAVLEKDPAKNMVTLEVSCSVNNKTALTGEAIVMVPNQE
ncbi:MAG: MaoC family dehydratase [Caulobacterales bacterium]|nr:MaoC family dehydratase [Caulobacterales bacterium]